VQKFLTQSEHGYLGYAVIVNKKFWDNLPADVRGALDAAMKDATKYANDIAKAENDGDIDNVRKSGKTQIVTLTPAERAALKQAMAPVHKQMAERIGADLIQSIQKEMAAVGTLVRGNADLERLVAAPLVDSADPRDRRGDERIGTGGLAEVGAEVLSAEVWAGAPGEATRAPLSPAHVALLPLTAAAPPEHLEIGPSWGVFGKVRLRAAGRGLRQE